MNKEDLNYINKSVNPYLEPMLVEFLAKKPKDPVKQTLIPNIHQIR